MGIVILFQGQEAEKKFYHGLRRVEPFMGIKLEEPMFHDFSKVGYGLMRDGSVEFDGVHYFSAPPQPHLMIWSLITGQ